MKNLRIGFVLFVVIAAITLALVSHGIAAGPQPTPSPTAAPTPDALTAAIDQAVQQAIRANPNASLFYQINIIRVENVTLDSTGTRAVAWMVPIDRATNEPVPTEPALAVLQKSASGQWGATLPTDPTYAAALAALPAGVLSPEQAESLLAPAAPQPQAVAQVFTGYFLPWEGKQGKILSGSIGHFLIYHSCTETSCRYAYDFYDGTMFPLLASKGGTVWSAYDACVNNDHTCTNYIVLRDDTTSPVTYQLYYHLANGTIPAALRSVGAPVSQGDFIGNADNTGYSTGSHLHFMVYADPTTPGSHWGNSVDIIFSDVTVNGGRPRTYYEATTFPSYGTGYMPDDIYISGNRYNPPPDGTLSLPLAYTQVNQPWVSVAGSAADSNGVTGLQVVANFDGAWTPVSPVFTTNPFSTQVDLCGAGVPDGPVTLGLWAWDGLGARNQYPLGAVPILKRYACNTQPPACTPSLNQVALYSQTDFRGPCQVFDLGGGPNHDGRYPTAALGAVGDNQTQSIQVGPGVLATLYDLDLSGRAESFEASDSSLSDNRIGKNMVSSLRVRPLAAPDAPMLNAPDVQAGVGLKSTDSATLTWSGDGGGTSYLVQVNLPDGGLLTSPRLKNNFWPVGSLQAGGYGWTVVAYNNQGFTLSSHGGFTVSAAALSQPAALPLPYSESFSNGLNNWTASGLWKLDTTAGNWATLNGTGTDYSSSTYWTGDLTSPPIALPAGAPAFLRFSSFYQTEGNAPFWDQRWVQISANNGPFTALYQMYDDMAYDNVHLASYFWLKSPTLNLSAYAGKTVRIRFHFDPLDRYYNTQPGWRVDDVTINTTPPDLSCAEAAPNDSPAQATAVGVPSVTSGVICPAGDLDYYRFEATAGQTLIFDIDARSLSPASSLDSYITLLDTDGTSAIAENDDEVSWAVNDSLLSYTFQHSGTYYLKVKSWSNPGSGGPSYFYKLKIAPDASLPVVALTAPNGPWLSTQGITLKAQASDAENGISHVDFYWHSPAWDSDSWQLAGSDTNGADGWSAAFDPSGKTLEGSALMVKAYDLYGLSQTAVTWQIQVDSTPPVSRLTALPASSNSTVFQLNWTASDNMSGLDHFDIQYTLDSSGTWQAWNTTLPGSARSAWFPALPGHTYGFSIRGTDTAGNVESFATSAEVSTAVASSCTPDAFEADNLSPNAGPLPLQTSEVHNFCAQNDEDWVKVTVGSPAPLLVRFQPQGGGAAAIIEVYNNLGQLVAQGQSPDYAQGVDLKVPIAAPGVYDIRIRPLNSGLWGTGTTYSIWAGDGHWVYEPLIR